MMKNSFLDFDFLNYFINIIIDNDMLFILCSSVLIVTGIILESSRLVELGKGVGKAVLTGATAGVVKSYADNKVFGGNNTDNSGNKSGNNDNNGDKGNNENKDNNNGNNSGNNESNNNNSNSGNKNK